LKRSSVDRETAAGILPRPSRSDRLDLQRYGGRKMKYFYAVVLAASLPTVHAVGAESMFNLPDDAEVFAASYDDRSELSRSSFPGSALTDGR
jgi:hypothetical protein